MGRRGCDESLHRLNSALIMPKVSYGTLLYDYKIDIDFFEGLNYIAELYALYVTTKLYNSLYILVKS